MHLTETYTTYLMDRQRDPMRRALAAAGLHLESELLGQQGWVDGASPTWVGPEYPAEMPIGSEWFDTVELCRMLVCPSEPLNPNERYSPTALAAMRPQYCLLSMSPVPRWKFEAFICVAPLRPVPIMETPRWPWFDPARILKDTPEQSPVLGLFAGEAYTYASWFGKGLPGQFDWQAADRLLGSLNSLWGGCDAEWSGVADHDDGLRMAFSPELLNAELVDGEPKSAFHDEGTPAAGVGLRTAVHFASGLFSRLHGDLYGRIPFELPGPLPRSG